MVTYINDAGLLGQIINGLTNDVTGSLFLTLLGILILLIVIALAFRIPVEGVAILYLPLMLTMLAMTSDYLAVTGCALILLGIILAKNLAPR